MKQPKKPVCKCGARLFLRQGIPVNKLCPACRTKKKVDKKEKHKLTKTYDEKTRKTVHKKCWTLISFIVRIEGTDENVYGECYTCLKIIHWKESNCSHFWHDRLDLDKRNLKRCCIYCNQHLHGNLGKYAERLIRENGLEWFGELERDAKNTIYKTQDLINLLPLLQEEAKQYEK